MNSAKINWKMMIRLWIAIHFLFVLFACTSTKSTIDKKKGFSLNGVEIKHIISVSPSFALPANLSSTKDGQATATLTPSPIQEEHFLKILQEEAALQGIALQIEGAAEKIDERDVNYFQYLAPFKREISQVLHLQDFKDVNQLEDLSPQPIQTFSKGLTFSSKYSQLAELYGTPYFFFQGIAFQTKGDLTERFPLSDLQSNDAMKIIVGEVVLIYYLIVANVVESEIVYRESQIIGTELSEKRLRTAVQQTFKNILK